MRRLIAFLVVVVALAAPAPALAASAEPDAVRLSASFDRGARLGGTTALSFALRIDPRRRPSPVSEIGVRYPSSLGIATSGLGTATCRLPAEEFARVAVELVGLAGCSGNAVMGYGTISARVQLGPLTVPSTAEVTMLAGPLVRDRMQLVALVDGVSPLGVRLLYGGELRPAPRPFGEALTVRFPPIPDLPAGSRFALVGVRLAIGTRDVVYRDEAGRRYRPEGIALPVRCPAGGFRFAADVRFEDGAKVPAKTTVPCPRRRTR